MIIFDALVACLVIKFFSTDALLALGITCMIAFLRLMPRLNRVLEAFEIGIIELIEENNEEEN